jgi:uroporphyrinogen-III synthase
MRILVTRPLPDAWDMKARIERLGHEASVAPLIEIVCEDLAPEAFDGAAGIIATSQNGLRALALSGLADKIRRLQVYAVGEATTKLATDLKLPNITAGRGTAEDLVPVIAERHQDRPGRLVHLAGDHLAFDLKGALAQKGIEVEILPSYKSVAAERLPPETVADLKRGRIGAVTLMSPRTAEIWAALTAKHGLQGDLSKLVHLCLSEAIAAKLQLGPAQRVEIAAEPNMPDMLALIKGLAA